MSHIPNKIAFDKQNNKPGSNLCVHIHSLGKIKEHRIWDNINPALEIIIKSTLPVGTYIQC